MDNYAGFAGLLPHRFTPAESDFREFIRVHLKRNLPANKVEELLTRFSIYFLEKEYVGDPAQMMMGTCSWSKISVAIGPSEHRRNWKPVVENLAHELGHAVDRIEGRHQDHDTPYLQRRQEVFSRVFVKDFMTHFGKFKKKLSKTPADAAGIS